MHCKEASCDSVTVLCGQLLSAIALAGRAEQQQALQRSKQHAMSFHSTLKSLC
jgi:hypothetical protein